MSPWFRRKRKETTEQQAAPQAPAPVEQPAPAELPSAEATADAATDPARKRRRGNRGGRGRKKPGAVAGAEGEATSEPKTDQPARRERSRPAAEGGQRSQGSQRQEAQRSQRQERRANQQGNRRRVPQKRAPLPKAKRELLISVDVGEQRVAILEDDRVAEVYLERPERRSIAGNIYLGTVDNVLPGMEAAFVEIGLEKNGFLYVDEIVVPELEGKRHHGKKITDLIARGQQIMVQAVKDPMKTKGARLTTEISLPGRFLVFVPQGEGLGVSRRLDDAERARLKEMIKGLEREGGRDHRPHRRRGRLGRGHRARPRLPAAALEDDPGEGEEREGAVRSSTRKPSCRSGSSATSSRATSRAPRSTTTARTSASSAT